MISLKPVEFETRNLKELLQKRYSCRSFKNKSLNLEEVSSILWAGAGKISDTLTYPTRTIPSAGAIYPLELFLVVGEAGVRGLNSGLYRYLWQEHALEPIVLNKDFRKELAEVCLNQDFIQTAPVSIIITADYSRTLSRYGERGRRYVDIEVGHVCQNIYLAVTNLGLATVEVGAFYDQKLSKLFNFDRNLSPLIVMPIGLPSE